MNRDNASILMQTNILSVFFVSLFSLSFETFLTRYFDIALFSAYSYWIISIAMFGYSLSGVFLSLFKDYFYKKRDFFLLIIPPLLLVFTVVAFIMLRTNPFNPLKIQNETLWKNQIAYVFLYYAGLFPLFFMVGIFIGLNFIIYHKEITKIYAMDLAGAAVGAITILALMFFIHPYHIVIGILPTIFIILLINIREYYKRIKIISLIALFTVCFIIFAVIIYYSLSISTLSFPKFKLIYSILHIKNNIIKNSIVSPSGFYLVLENYTEYDDIPMTNNYSVLNISSPPKSYGIYKDGERISPLLKKIPSDFSYVKGALSEFPYITHKNPTVLLIGSNGGYKILESVYNKPLKCTALVPQKPIYRLINDTFKKLNSDYLKINRVTIYNLSPFSYITKNKDKYDIIEVASDFLNEHFNNRFSLTEDAILLYINSLKYGGILSIPVSIAELSVYPLKMINTIITALKNYGIKDPSNYIMVYRTAWTCQILVSNRAFSKSDIDKFKKFCDARSFDTPYYPGINPSSVTIWNDLPAVSFKNGTYDASNSPTDSIMTALTHVFSSNATSGKSFLSSNFFNLSPITIDKPDFYSILRLSKLPVLFSHISALPQKEIGYLINIIVLVQSILFALFILFFPVFFLKKKLKSLRSYSSLFRKTILYFSALGLGYLFIELSLIEKFSFFLENTSTSFGIILSTMLIFSGIGSSYSSKFKENPYKGLLKIIPFTIADLLFFILLLDRFIISIIALDYFLKVLITIILVAPISFTMGWFFPLGNLSFGIHSDILIPWAWAINGAFSVVSTPLAKILSTIVGWKIILSFALLLYISTIITFPKTQEIE